MTDCECVELLQWMLPRLHRRWPGYRRVRKQVCRRIAGRIRLLGLSGAEAYRRFLETHPDEWQRVDGLCAVTISRFYRDRRVFECLTAEILPRLAREARERDLPRLWCWCAGCASGEEPYSVALAWELGVARPEPTPDLRIVATDVDSAVLQRAARRSYPLSSLKELPPSWRTVAFEPLPSGAVLRDEHARRVSLVRHDARTGIRPCTFALILCRNLAFTYFDRELQCRMVRQFGEATVPGGALIVGSHERLPVENGPFEPWPGCRGVYRRRAGGKAGRR